MARNFNHARLSAYYIKMFICSSDSIYYKTNICQKKNWMRIKRNLLSAFENFAAYLVHEFEYR